METSVPTETKLINIDNKHAVKMFEDRGSNWFCVTDICDCLGINSKPVRVTRNIDDEHKRTVLVKDESDRGILFVDENSAYGIIYKSRSKNSKVMKEMLFKFIKGKKPIRHIDKDKQSKNSTTTSTSDKTNTTDDTEILTDMNIKKHDPEVNLILDKVTSIKDKHINTSKFNVPSNISAPASALSEQYPQIPSIIVQTPELAEKYLELEKYKFDTELQFRKIRMEIEAETKRRADEHETKVKLEQLKANQARDVSNRKLEYMRHAEVTLQLSLENASFEDRERLAPILQAHAMQTQKLLWGNNNDNDVRSQIPLITAS
jgi:prophage antirepressor-like protein